VYFHGYVSALPLLVQQQERHLFHVPHILKHSLLVKVEEENEGEPTHMHLENGHQSGDGCVIKI